MSLEKLYADATKNDTASAIVLKLNALKRIFTEQKEYHEMTAAKNWALHVASSEILDMKTRDVKELIELYHQIKSDDTNEVQTRSVDRAGNNKQYKKRKFDDREIEALNESAFDGVKKTVKLICISHNGESVLDAPKHVKLARRKQDFLNIVYNTTISFDQHDLQNGIKFIVCVGERRSKDLVFTFPDKLNNDRVVLAQTFHDDCPEGTSSALPTTIHLHIKSLENGKTERVILKVPMEKVKTLS